MKNSPPNIIFIMADQLAAGALSCYGFEAETSPNLDRLAAHGVKFNRNYAVAPICGPNRACIFTGRTSAAHRVYYNNLPMNENLPHVTQVLRTAGYATGGFGKFHFEDMDLPPPASAGAYAKYGFDEIGFCEDPRLGPWLEWVEREHPEYAEAALSQVWPRPYFTEEERKAWQAAYEKHMQPRISPPFNENNYVSSLPVELHPTRWITDQAIDFIDRAEAPCFTFVSYVGPHWPHDPPAPYHESFSPEDLPPPLPAEWEWDDLPAGYAEQMRPLISHAETMQKPRADYTIEDWQMRRAMYLGSTRFIDDEIGRLLAHLRETDRERDTVVVFTTDHGDTLGDHWLDGKGTHHYDKSIRTPLIIRDPRRGPAGAVVDRLTSSLDLFPTLCDLAGADCSDITLCGQSVLGRPEETEPACRELLIVTEDQDPARCVRSLLTEDGWRLTVFPGEDYGEMFHLLDDPDEQRNLYRDEAYADKRAALMQRLVEQLSGYIHDGYTLSGKSR